MLLLALGCSSSDDGGGDGPPTFDYPRDGELRLHQLQAKGTHNSYHVMKAGTDIAAHKYTHVPLDQQLATQGVRAIELDTRWDAVEEQFVVFHLGLIDEETTCRRFVDCLAAVDGWSRKNPAHHPIFVQIEPKDALPGDRDAYFSKLEAAIVSVLPRNRIITPDDVKAGALTLRDAITGNGWPTLGEARGKVVFFVDDSTVWSNAYAHDGQHLDGRLMFVDAPQGAGYEAIHVMNDPVGGASDIAQAVAAGFLVRTRADSDSVEPIAGDTVRRDAAFASGAHIVSTDYPAPVQGVDYFVDVPAGTPSRCNPANAPADCRPEDIEDPQFIR